MSTSAMPIPPDPARSCRMPSPPAAFRLRRLSPPHPGLRFDDTDPTCSQLVSLTSVMVAAKFLEDVPMPSDKIVSNVSTIFAQTQTSVLQESASMLSRLGRPNYVTPTNYLELVKGYCKPAG